MINYNSKCIKNKILYVTLLMLVIIFIVSSCGKASSGILTSDGLLTENPTFKVTSGQESPDNSPESSAIPSLESGDETQISETEVTSTEINVSPNTNVNITPSNSEIAPSPPVTTKSATTTKPSTETTKPLVTAKAPVTTKPVTTPVPTQSMKIPNDSVLSPINLISKVPADLKEDFMVLYTNLKSRESVDMKGELVIKSKFQKDIVADITRLRKLIYYIRDYNPEFYYIDWTRYSYSQTKNSVTKEVISSELILFLKKENISSSDINKFENKIDDIVAEANKKSNLFERELYVHDYLVKNVAYDKTTAHCGDVYGAIIEGKAKCEGYARAFQYIMLKLGIETYLTTGISTEGHMWNMVKLYGDYYFVDVVFDDPIPDVKIKDGQEHLIDHTYFNVTTKFLSKTHTISAKGSLGEDGLPNNVDLQTCTSEKYSYIKIKG